MPDSIVDTLGPALIYARAGLAVTPIRPESKKPFLSDWPKRATTNAAEIEATWRQFPGCNVGIVTGKINQLVVLDIDVGKGGEESLLLLQSEHERLPDTWICRTGGGGRHLYFRYHGAAKLRNSASQLGLGLDVRAEHGVVVAPPSLHPNGAQYEWEDGCDPTIPLADLPDWLIDLMLNGNSRNNGQAAKFSTEEDVPEGGRHGTLVSLAAMLHARSGLQGRALLGCLQGYNLEFCKPPTPYEEVKRIANDISMYADQYEETDDGNGRRYADRVREGVRWVGEWSGWGVWQNGVWVTGSAADNLAYSQVDLVIQDLFARVKDLPPEMRAGAQKWLIASQSRGRKVAMMEDAKPRLFISSSDFDTHPLLVNLRNGTLDLATREFYTHNPADMLTYQLEFDYDPQAACPHWLDHVNLVTNGQDDMIHFLQVALGYSLTGRIDEHALIYLYGTGKNGKTTLLEGVRRMMGRYCRKIDVNALLSRKSSGDAPTPSVAALKGCRIVTTTEMPEGRHLDEALVKSLTGGDTIAARKLYADVTEFQPTHKLWMDGNYKPKIEGDDLGIWRRIRVFPMLSQIQHVRNQEEVLAEFAAEKAGILNWMLAGAYEWLEHGLPEAKAVSKATEEYRGEEDVVQQFINEQLVAKTGASIDRTTVYGMYINWCKGQGENPRTQNWLTRRIEARGFERAGAGRSMYQGLDKR